jgi:hypothetical protein
MTTFQRYTIVVGLSLFLLASLFPPWVQTYHDPAGSQVKNDAGYHLLFTPPPTGFANSIVQAAYPDRFGITLDVQRLAVEYILIIGIAAVLHFVGRTRTAGRSVRVGDGDRL